MLSSQIHLLLRNAALFERSRSISPKMCCKASICGVGATAIRRWGKVIVGCALSWACVVCVIINQYLAAIQWNKTQQRKNSGHEPHMTQECIKSACCAPNVPTNPNSSFALCGLASVALLPGLRISLVHLLHDGNVFVRMGTFLSCCPISESKPSSSVEVRRAMATVRFNQANTSGMARSVQHVRCWTRSASRNDTR